MHNSCLGKLFSTVLNIRLEKYVYKNDIIHPAQIGFRKGARTADHIFTLSTLIDKYVRKKKAPLYACFVDFKKAYDSVWREGLFLKMQKYNIKGNFYKVVKSMYDQSVCCIRANGKQGGLFNCRNGVKQGETLSPILFNVFLNDLPETILKGVDKDHIPDLNGRALLLLLYADDLILLSTSAEGLQKEINALGNFCNKWNIQVNVKKTKVMKFVGNGHACKDVFTLSGSPLENCQTYKYLGVVISSSGSFTRAQVNAANKAKKALFKIRSCLRNIGCNPKIGLKLFDQLVSPILLYCSEVWTYRPINKKKFNKEGSFDQFFNEGICESVNLSFCKFILGVGKKTGNIPVMSELGRFPISHRVVLQMNSYWKHLTETNNPILKDALYESKKLNSEGHHSWVSFYEFMCKKLKVKPDAGCKKEMKDILQKRYCDMWKKDFYDKYNNCKEGKFGTYVHLKDKFCYENYLDQIPNRNHRRALTKLRLSNHCLKIEKGRYKRPIIPREDRVCEFCIEQGNRVVEDEVHFLLSCPALSELRDDTIHKIEIVNRNLSLSDKFYYFMNSEGNTVRTVAKFCFVGLRDH